MKDSYFIDTNIFVYSFDLGEKEKREKAKAIIKKALRDGKGFISIQVIQEFYNIATRKFEHPMPVLFAKEYLDKVFMQLNVVYPTSDFIATGLDLAATTKYSFYDSLIISAALKAGCSVLYTEDMQDRQTIRNLSIVNPLKSNE
jgi:predicted nucleic acid-binding protein